MGSGDDLYEMLRASYEVGEGVPLVQQLAVLMPVAPQIAAPPHVSHSIHKPPALSHIPRAAHVRIQYRSSCTLPCTSCSSRAPLQIQESRTLSFISCGPRARDSVHRTPAMSHTSCAAHMRHSMYKTLTLPYVSRSSRAPPHAISPHSPVRVVRQQITQMKQW